MNKTNTFEECLGFERKTSETVEKALQLFGFSNIYKVDYEERLWKSLQRKGVDYIASILWSEDIWIDAKVRSYTGFDYTDIAIEEKSLDTIQKRNDSLLYVTPNSEAIVCYHIDLNILRKCLGDIKPLFIKEAKKDTNETIFIYRLETLRKKNIMTSLSISYRVFDKSQFIK